MKNKKSLYVVLGIIGILLLGVIVYLSVNVFPKLKIGKEISDLLQPILTEENQAMHLDVSADLAGEVVDVHSDLYLVKDEEINYVVMDQYDFPIYIVDNVLYLENGHAFKIAEEVQNQQMDYKELFLQIAAAYEIFDITCVKTDAETGYGVNVTGEQVQELLSVVMPANQSVESSESDVLKYIENLNIQLTAKNGTIDRIELSGSADVNDTKVQISITISEFHVLEVGEYVIPDVVKDAVKTVDKDSLFNLTEDLYRLMVAFERFSKQETLNGTVTITANCGIIDFKQSYDMKDFDNMEHTANEAVDVEGLENLPEMIGFLCMEGEISCTELDTSYEYKLALDKEAMQKIAEMVVPDLINYVVTMTEGTVLIELENESISSITIEIDGSIKVLFSEVPAEVGVEFEY